jgi:hypothetical protein
MLKNESCQRFEPGMYKKILLLALTILTGSSAFAQLAGKGTIKGTVTDPSGAVVPNAQVTAISTTRGTALTVTSSASGDYEISPLDADIYTVTIKAQGFSTTTQENVHVNSLEVANLNVVLKLGSETETVTVSAQPPALETSNATLGATMEQDMYSALPIEMGAYGQPDQRRATDFAFLMPGVQGNNTNGNPTTNTGIVNGSGSRGAVSAVYINGIPFVRAGGNGDPRYVWTAISVDAVNQFQVQTSGYSAIYEGQGIQNYTIKQGGTQFHGGVYEFFRNTALDTWGFFRANSPSTGLPVKPIEHMNEFGINLGGPLLPIKNLKDKLFFFGNYGAYRYSSTKPTPITFPTLAEQQGNFQALTQTGNPGNNTITVGIYDPSTEALCTSRSTDGPCRYQYGWGPSATTGKRGNPQKTGAPIDVIPASQFSTVASKLQSFIPALNNQNAQNNYFAPNATALSNWSTTDRIDYNISAKDTVTLTAAIGRQASSIPVGQTTSGRNVGPVPYNYGQAYAPKTAVGIIEETHIFTPHVINQFKYGYARYDGPTFNANQTPAYAASAMGLTGLPVGQAQQTFPIVTFAGTNAPTNWGGTTANRVIAQNYTLLDNVQWVLGRHSLTLGGQIAWMLYNNIPATGSSTPLTIANAVTETAGLNSSTNGSYAATANTGLAYASFLVGQIDKGSLSQYLYQDFGSRFRAISPYVQDNYKVNDKLTLDIGLRWDYFPTVREAHDLVSFFNPNLANPVTGINGALQFAGTGSNTCNCRTPVNDWYKNFGPRLGLAYQLDEKTVLRASYGLMFTHGNAVGGGTPSQLGAASNSLGFSASPSSSANGQLLSTFPLDAGFPSYTAATGRASGPAYGTGFAKASGYTGNPSGMGYFDPYLGGRTPEYLNWTFGFQHQWTNAFTSSITYVGSQGHFLVADGSNARGYWADQLDPQYLSLNTNLGLAGPPINTFCAANSGVCPAGALAAFNTPTTGGQQLNVLLKPFPFQSVSDSMGMVANSNYHSLQMSFNMRPTHGVTLMANYTWSRSIDDGGTFRTGYAIPAAYSGNGKAYKADAIERSVSTSSQPQHAVVTGVWDMPFGRTVLAENAVERAILGGFRFSTIYQAYSGSPLAITAASCATNPAQSTCMPSLSPAFSGPARINGKWGQGVTAANFSAAPAAGQVNGPNNFIDKNAFVTNNAYQFGNAPRTAAWNIYGPGNYQLDISLRRSFGLRFRESAKLSFQADMYNVTNHTQFSVASAVWGNASFGQVGGQANLPRQVQLTGRFDF